MSDALQLAVTVGVPVLTCGATVVWHLAHASRLREDVATLRADVHAARQEIAAAATAIAVMSARAEERELARAERLKGGNEK